MSILRFLKKYWQTKSGRKKKKKYSSTLGGLLQLDDTTQRTQKRRTSNSQPDAMTRTIPEDEREQLWIHLSSREQDVTAFTCLKYTNRQIAARLGLSTETVRTYLVTVLHKLNLDNKADLRVLFASWNFSEWERRDPNR